MEITGKLQAENPEFRSGQTGASRISPAKVLAELVTGARFQGTVTERQGGFEMIDVAGQMIRARSNAPLPQGANVELEVVKEGSPIQVRLLSVIDPNAASSARKAAAINRELLGVRAGFSKLNAIFGRSTLYSPDTGNVSSTRADETAVSFLRNMAQGARPDTTALRAVMALFQPPAGSGTGVIDDIVAVLRAFVPSDSGQSDNAWRAGQSISEGGASLGNSRIVQSSRQVPSGVKGMLSGTQTETGKDDGISGKATQPHISGGDGNPSMKGGEIPSKISASSAIKEPDNMGVVSGRGAKTDAAPGARTANSGQGARISGNTASRESVGQGSSSLPDSQARATSSQGSGVSPANSGETDSGFVSLASRISMPGANESNAYSGRPAVTGHETGVKPENALNSQSQNISSTQTGKQDVIIPGRQDGVTLSKTISQAVSEKSDNQALNIQTASGDGSQKGSKTALQSDTGTLVSGTRSDANSSVISHGTRQVASSVLSADARHREVTAKTDPGARAEQPGSSQPQGPAASQPEARQETVQRFFNALSAHADSIQHFQQQVHNYLNTPFFMIPLWFENGAGHGHWSWWQDEGEQDGEATEKVQHLVFDLELTHLGRINFHILQEEQGIKLYAAASREILPLLRSGIGELRTHMQAHGFNFAVADIFALDESGATELFTPVPHPGASESSLNIVA